MSSDVESDPRPSFADLGIDERILRALADVGYETPSPIQAATIPALLAGRHVVGLAQTGTGKTAAFAVPILSQIDLKQKAPQALVLAPTRELALQVSEAFERYASHLPGLHVLPVYGGQAYGVQLSALRRGVHVVVGTPGRIMDHLEKGTLDLTQLRFLVLDEADEMLKMGFQEDVETILADTPADKHVALFSATMPAQIRRISKKYLTDAAEITVKNKTVTAANTTQRYLMVTHQQKLDALTRVLEIENFEGMIIFVRTKQATEVLAERLRARGFSAAAINGDVAQVQRERTIDQLRDGRLDILVATDVAARGLDVERISHVVNYDIPTDTESYVHRIGRTGRAGRTGDALSFVTPRERHLLKAIERATRQPLTLMPLPSVEDVNTNRVAKFTESITTALGSDKLGFFRELISDYEQQHDVPATDIAAALAVLVQDDEPLLLAPEAETPQRAFEGKRESGGVWDHEKGRRRDRDERPKRRESGPRKGRSSVPLAPYTIAVGKRHRVEPRQIVGALANEGGLNRGDFGHIDIRGDHSVVELPADLPPETWRALENTRISGRLIALREGGGQDSGAERSPGAERPDGPRKKPRTKKADRPS
ncbi:DEAD/DEAH box helicase [Nocardioides mesophilus]|uniref:ATP-dependent RNA helicase DeaD n=1 Tax=Nocardioides mesophilus TaxID=433659 RepID=A0A7G9RB85_9ACTN|nr:DEAD/DEAH box helicase [Nocardioides mesophilus]QNN52860.1 DEAD/DEAH box helicase [Nocardioides mesophilus]